MYRNIKTSFVKGKFSTLYKYAFKTKIESTKGATKYAGLNTDNYKKSQDENIDSFAEKPSAADTKMTEPRFDSKDLKMDSIFDRFGFNGYQKGDNSDIQAERQGRKGGVPSGEGMDDEGFSKFNPKKLSDETIDIASKEERINANSGLGYSGTEDKAGKVDQDKDKDGKKHIDFPHSRGMN
jgi:hypothetical protein